MTMTMRGNGQADGQLGHLEAGRAVERELSGGQSHFYEIGMASGQYLHLVVDQRGIDVVVVLFAPNGEKRIEMDSPNGTAGPEILSVVTDVAGTYRIDVRALEKTAKPGRYEIKIAELRTATAEDRDRLAAEANFHEALQLENGDLDSKRKSCEKLQRALELYRRAGDRAGETATIRKLARIYFSVGELRQSLEKYNELLPFRRAAGDRAGESETISDIGMVRQSLGGVRESLVFYNLSLLIDRETGNRRGEAATLNNIAEAYKSLGEMQMALEKFNEALIIERAFGNHKNEAIVLNNIGHLYHLLGERQKALEYYNESLAIFRTAGDRRDEASVLNNIGQLHSETGETQKALETFNQSLPITRAVGDRISEAYILTNIGHATYSLGEKRKALEYYQQALALFRLTGDRISEGSAASLIGQDYQSLGEGEKALENFNNALLISRETGERSGEAIALLNIAREEQNRGELTRACQDIEQAITIVESLRTRITSEDLRASYLADHPDFYGTYIDILMQMHRQNPSAGWDAAALAVSERARARSLLELLAEARADIRRGVDSLLIERERSLQQNLAAKATAQVSLLAGRHTPEQAEAMAREIAGITDEYEKVEAKIRASSPRYIALTQPQPLNLSEIQKQVLDA
ncbi:MAG: tetratricopeptide repeat protein, partial [Blastocatellia bacterium]|nr:tetratricopeptide repeat protein [Blastocatellia bacterium]